MIWDQTHEAMDTDKMQALQLEKLQETVKWVYERVPFYKQKFEELGVTPQDVKSLEDLSKLPFTIKTDLRDNYPFGLCAVPINEVARVHASSGTTGKPITGPYTKEDIDQWAECMARNFTAAGVTKDDICHNAYGLGLFTGGLGFHQAVEKLGCTLVPASSGMTERQITLLKDFNATVLLCTPSYALTIAEKANDMGVDLRSCRSRLASSAPNPGLSRCARKSSSA